MESQRRGRLEAQSSSDTCCIDGLDFGLEHKHATLYLEHLLARQEEEDLSPRDPLVICFE